AQFRAAPHHRPGRAHGRPHTRSTHASGRAHQTQRPADQDRGRWKLMPEIRRRDRGRKRTREEHARTAQAPLVAGATDRARALALTPLSRETLERLDQFVELLLAWQLTTNLIAPSTAAHLWTRHIADSLQLLEL